MDKPLLSRVPRHYPRQSRGGRDQDPVLPRRRRITACEEAAPGSACIQITAGPVGDSPGLLAERETDREREREERERERERRTIVCACACACACARVGRGDRRREERSIGPGYGSCPGTKLIPCRRFLFVKLKFTSFQVKQVAAEVRLFLSATFIFSLPRRSFVILLPFSSLLSFPPPS
jgi:hypothetical protein